MINKNRALQGLGALRSRTPTAPLPFLADFCLHIFRGSAHIAASDSYLALSFPGRIVDLPLSEPFPVLAEAVVNIKHAVDQVSSDATLMRLSEEQW